MKKMRKKLLALLLCISVLLLSFTACGGNDAKDTGTKPEATPTTAPAADDKGTSADAAATPEPEEVDPYPTFDFGGRTIKVGIWWDYFYTSDHDDVMDDPGVIDTETAQMKLDNVRRIEEKYNCKIQFVNYGWDGIISSLNTSVTAGTPECDIYLTDLQFGIPAVQNGLAQDLKAIAPEYTDLFNEQKIIKPLEGLGGTYFFTEQGIVQHGIFLGYNATMINDLGLEDPQQLYKEGKWTWEKFAEQAKAGTRDTDADGTTDIYGYGGSFIDLINGLVMNNGGDIAATTTEGLSKPQTVEAFEFIDRLYNKDMSARPWNGDDWDDNLLAWSDGKVMFWTAQAWSLDQQKKAAIAEGAELPFEYHVVPYPTGPSGDPNVMYSPVAGNWYIIPVGVQEPGKVLQIFEEFLNWHKGDPELRDDTTAFEACFNSLEDVDIAIKSGLNMKFDIWNSLGDYFRLSDMIFWPVVVRNDTTVAQAIESAKPVLQEALNYFYEK